MKNIIFFSCFLLSISLLGQRPVFEWAVLQGGNYSESINHTTIDTFGNIYVSGRFSSTVDFDPGPEESNLTAQSNDSNFVSKFDERGQFEWAVSLDLNHNNRIYDMATDAFGNVYIVGSYSNTVDFNPGAGTYNLSSFGNRDVFILKLDSNGHFEWVKNMGGLGYDEGLSIAVDNNGNLFTTGYYSEYAIFSSNPIEALSSSTPKAAFISKHDNNGQLLWNKSIDTNFYDEETAIAIDGENDLYLMGHFRDTVDFDPGAGQYHLNCSDNLQKLFVLKLDNDGTFIWARSTEHDYEGYSNPIKGLDIAVDQHGNSCVSGYFRRTIDFDPGVDTAFLSSTSQRPFLLKLNSQGNYLWAKNMEYLYASDIAFDSNNNLYRIGSFYGSVDFDLGLDTFSLSSGGSNDSYIQKLDPNGDFIWAGSFSGSNGNQTLNSISIDPWDNIYTGGRFRNTVDFAPDSATYQITSNGSYDVFIHKMRNQTCASNPIITSNQQDFSVCRGDSITLTTEAPFGLTDVSYNWDSGQDTDSINIAPNSTSSYTAYINYNIDTTTCYGSATIEVSILDTVNLSITDDFEICANSEVTIGASGGESYIWSTGDSTNLTTISPTESQHYIVTAINTYGCQATDSVAVSVLPLSDTTFVEFITCDSTLLQLIEITFLNQNGCDSIVIENPVFLPLPEATSLPIDTIIQQYSPPFQISSSQGPNATSYSWTVPAGVQIISGADTNSIMVDWGDLPTGGFVCLSAINECGQSEEACMEIILEVTNATAELNAKEFAIFPNPSTGLFQIVFPTFTEGRSYELRDLSGKLISSGLVGKETKLDLTSELQGLYLLSVKTNLGVWTERVVKL